MRLGRGPVHEFYQASLARTGSSVHARLNTQRKLLLTLWRLWRTGGEFEPKRFLGHEPQPTAKVTCG